jgi:hypothetical protein
MKPRRSTRNVIGTTIGRPPWGLARASGCGIYGAVLSSTPYPVVQVRKIVLSAVGLGVLCLLALLLIEVTSSPASTVPEDELARARAAHARLQAGSGVAAVRDLDIEPSARPEVRQRDAEEPEDDDRNRRARPSRAPARPPTIVDRSAARPTVTIAGREKSSVEVRMNEVNGFYDRGNYLDAHEAALEVLADQPRNVRMLRVAVSTSCILGEVDRAAKMYERLPEKDQRDMAKRCSEQYGIQLGAE